MTENVKKLNELAHADEALAKRLTEAQDKEAVVAIAAEVGITLTDADFEAVEAERKRVILAQGNEQLSDDELDAVAGGDYCFCLAGGGGVYRKGRTRFKEGADLTCGCVGYGEGDYEEYYNGRTYTNRRCLCIGYGDGVSQLMD